MTQLRNDTLAGLEWQAAMGAEDYILDAPQDRYAESAAPTAKAAPAPHPVPAAARPKPGLAPAPPPAPVASLGAADAVAEARRLAAACASLEELRAAVEGFEGCPLKRTATTTVFGDGFPQAEVMFIGEAPGRDEDRQGKPFVGVSGRMLDRMLGFINLDRTRFYITNSLYWWPPGNRTPTDGEVATCLPFLQRQIELVNPRLLVLVGGRAAKTFFATSQGITRLRGSWRDYSHPGLAAAIPALAMFHPAYLLRSPEQKRLAWRDILALRARMAESGILPPSLPPRSPG